MKGDKGQVWPSDKNEEEIAASGDPRNKPDVAEEALGADREGSSRRSSTPAVEALLADLARLRRSPGTPAADRQPAEQMPDGSLGHVPEVNGATVRPAGDVAGAERGLNTAGTDALFEAMARYQQLPEFSGMAVAAEGARRQSLPGPEGNVSTTAGRAEQSGFEPAPVRTLLGGFSVALSVLVLGPLAFLGLHRATRKPRFAAGMKLAKGPVNDPSCDAHRS